MGAIAAVVSVVSFTAFLQRDEVLLSGDAVAHIGIARRVFDSLTPGPLQLGTVWLPLQHLLTIPFIVSDSMWRSGIGGSIPSMVGYVLAAIGVYRLVRITLQDSRPSGHASAAAWFAAAVIIANPNLIYVQATALNESLYLAEFVWAMAFLSEFARLVRRGDSSAAVPPLRRCALVLAAAILTRYDGWVLTMACGLVVFAVLVRFVGARELLAPAHHALARGVLSFVLLCAVAPALWMAYNYGVFKDPLDFARGPYSANAIMQRTMRPGDPFHPGYHSPLVAGVYFVKDVKLNLAGAGHWEPGLLLLALLGVIVAIRIGRWIVLLLWVPLPFYAYSIAYGAIPIFIPVWWPFSYYNTRYGLQLLPAVAVFCGVSLAFCLSRVPRWRTAVAAGFLIVLIASYASVWAQTPICLREVRANSATRIPYEKALAAELETLPTDARLLMFVGDHFDALRRADIPLRRVINESNYTYWQPALAHPARWADYVIAADSGPVAESANRHSDQLETLAIINSRGQPRTTIYKTRRSRPVDTIQQLSP